MSDPSRPLEEREREAMNKAILALDAEQNWGREKELDGHALDFRRGVRAGWLAHSAYLAAVQQQPVVGSSENIGILPHGEIAKHLRQQPEQEGEDTREWKLVAGRADSNPSLDEMIEAGRQGKLPPRPMMPRWFVFAAPSVPDHETLWVVPKSRAEAAESRAAGFQEGYRIEQELRKGLEAKLALRTEALKKARALIDSEVDNATETAVNADRAAAVIDAALDDNKEDT